MKFSPDIDNTSIVGFKSRKAAQVCAYFAAKTGDTGMEKLKLIKLVYLAERDSLRAYGQPMLFDEMFSLKDGPICSSTLNGINDCAEFPTWRGFITRNDRIVRAVKKYKEDTYDDLSPADIDILEEVWSSFGHMTASQIRQHTHEFCPEYTLVMSGRLPISYKDVFIALGEENPDELCASIDAYRRSEAVLSA